MARAILRPQYTPTPGPTIGEMAAGLARWAEARPQLLEVETVGESPGGLPMLLCRITDEGVPDEDKQVASLTTTHTGVERSGASTVLKLVKWLVSDDPVADEIRRKQIVVAMPACEPDTYDRRSTDVADLYSGRGCRVYGAWTWDGPTDPVNQPEAMAVKRVMDENQPDVHVVYHNPGTIVQVSIQPGQVRGFHVVTGVFESDEQRPAGFQPEDWSL